MQDLIQAVFNIMKPNPMTQSDGWKNWQSQKKASFLLVVFFVLWLSEITYQLPAQTGNTGRKRQHTRVLQQNPATPLPVSGKKQYLEPHKEQLKQQHSF